MLVLDTNHVSELFYRVPFQSELEKSCSFLAPFTFHDAKHPRREACQASCTAMARLGQPRSLRVRSARSPQGERFSKLPSIQPEP